MTLRELLYKFINEYASELEEAKSTENYKRPFGNLVRHDIADQFQSAVDSDVYKVKGSVGAGRWTDVPWVAVFDKRITTSAQKGVYIVYLLNKESKELYLTLNQGATDVAQGGGNNASGQLAFTGIAAANNTRTMEGLKTRAEEIRSRLGHEVGLNYGEISCGSSAYDAGCIYYKKYTLHALPEDEELYKDLKEFVEAYRMYYEQMYQSTAGATVNKSPLLEKGGEEELSKTEVLKNIKNYIDSQGFSFDANLIANYYLSLRAKPFVILAGTSGTGKTKLVELFAEAIGATYDNGQYLLVPVRPDWSDSTDLLGHMNLNGEFVPGAIVDFICEANKQENLNKPYFLCLDEMNLARVEYYLSDILSVIETRKHREDGTIGSLPLFNANYFNDETKIAGTDEYAKEKYQNVYLSENLYIVGTVNMDETTFPFSKKVLDRANTIEFSKVDTLVPDFSTMDNDGSGETIMVTNDFLKADYTKIKECSAQKDLVAEDCKILQELNEILEKAEAHVGYRVRDEIEFYLLYSREISELMQIDNAFDNEIMQKILPRIQGSGEVIVKLLEDLIEFCGAETVKYSKSKAKLEAMKERCGEYGQGYTSYWL